MLFPPATHNPVPTGNGTVGSTSEPSAYGLKLFEKKLLCSIRIESDGKPGCPDAVNTSVVNPSALS
jgi:hypothetical protein